jgi:uncharacterized protein
VMMAATAVAMIHGRRGGPDQGAREQGRQPRVPVGRTLLIGAAVGLLTGLIGAGGGFLIVPALVLLGGLSMPVSVGTSLLVVALNSVAGLSGHLSVVRLDWGLAGMVTAAAVAGSLVGARLGGRVSPEHLRKSFGWLVLGMAALVLVQELPARWQPLPASGRLGVAVTVSALLLGLGLLARRLGRRGAAAPAPAPAPAPATAPAIAAPDREVATRPGHGTRLS